MAIYTNILAGGSNSHETTSENANALATDFLEEGVVGAITNTAGVAPATGGFAVNAQGTPDMTVAVSAGVAYVTATPSGQGSQVLRVKNTATANVTIAANSSGSTKYDWIYISINATNAANPAVAGDNVATLVASRSTSSSSDDGTPPTYGYPLAVVTVANGAASIANGSIADSRDRVIPTPDGSIDTEHLADASVTPAKLLAGTGADWAWQDWTPNLTNISGGTLNYAKYIQIGKTVHFRLAYTLGGAGVAGSVGFDLPETSVTYLGSAVIGHARFQDTGTTAYYGRVQYTSTTTATVAAELASGTYTAATAISSTIPHTWASTDILSVTGTYEAA